MKIGKNSIQVQRRSIKTVSLEKNPIDLVKRLLIRNSKLFVNLQARTRKRISFRNAKSNKQTNK